MVALLLTILVAGQIGLADAEPEVGPMQTPRQAETMVFIENGEPGLVDVQGRQWTRGDGYLECQGVGNYLWAGKAVGAGDFHIRARLAIHDLTGSAATFEVNGRGHFGFEGAHNQIFVGGPLFGQARALGSPDAFIRSGEPFIFEVSRTGDVVSFRINGEEVAEGHAPGARRFGIFGFRPWRSRMQVFSLSATGVFAPPPPPREQPVSYSIPTIDLANETWRQRIVERKEGQYLGHPTTVLMPDGKTIFCTYPLGHGGPAAVLKKSTDGGNTWSERLRVPENWATARNCPCLHRLIGPDGTPRLFVFEGNGQMRQAMSLDNGDSWTPFEPNGLRCIVAPITILEVSGGRHLMMYHRGAGDRDVSPLTCWQAISEDGGMTWKDERECAAIDWADPCEPAMIRSPDGRQIAAIMRENARRYNSFIMFSDDEGATWSQPVETPASLTGDRHMPRYSDDGRLVMAFRDMADGSPTKGDVVAWVGTYEDLVSGREGQYRVRLLNSPTKVDLGYPGVELLPDGTFVATTYAVINEGEEHSVVSVRFKLSEVDEKAAGMPTEQIIYRAGADATHTYRIPSLALSKEGTVLAFCEARRESTSDFGNIDMALKRSTDGGETFGEMQILADDERNTMGNPCPVVLRETGEIVLLLCRNNGRVFAMRSNDEGITWSAPEEITDSVRRIGFDWTRVATGPGNGIQMTDGRVVIPMWYMAGKLSGEEREYRAGVIFSDDGGVTWAPGETVAPKFRDCNECEVVEASDGRLCLNMRTNSGNNRRAIAWSDDSGATWSEPELDDALLEPVCDASMIRCETRSGQPVWLFANCYSKQRNNMSVRASLDEGNTWTAPVTIWPGPSAYPCLLQLADGTIACLYERGDKSPYESLSLARFDLQWVLGR